MASRSLILRFASATVLFCSTLIGSAGAKLPAGTSSILRPIAITHVSIVDVKAGIVLPDRTVILSGERIMQVAPARTARLPANAFQVDGRSRFLMPGLIDSHVHLNNPEREVPMLVASGVTLVRDMGGEIGERLAARAQARRGDFYGLEMICVGTILDGKPPYHAWSRACGTPEEGRAAVRNMAAVHVDQIKVYSLLKPDVHRAICNEAKRLGLKVVGHVPDALTLQAAIDNGQQGVEHLTGYRSLLQTLLPNSKPQPGAFDYGIWAHYPDLDKTRLQQSLRGLAATGVAQCPTLVLYAGQARILDTQTQSLWNLYAPPSDRQSWSQIPSQYAEYSRSLAVAFPFLQQTVRDLNAANVPLLIGTDLGNPGILAGFALHTEMRYWQDAGVPPAAILRAATLAPARFFGLQARLGTVEPGKTASLLLLRANPLRDMRNAAKIDAVFAQGRYLNRAALRQLLDQAHAETLAISPAPDTKESFALPGQAIARGHYNLFYQQYPDGTEDFAITKDGNQYRFTGVRNQPGFGRYKSVQTGTWDLGFTPQQIVSEPRVLLPTVERYQVAQGTLSGNATRNGKPITRTHAQFAATSTLRSPLLAMDFFLFHHAALQVGETKTVETFLLSQQGWRPKPQTIRVTRRTDETVTLANGQAILCHSFLIENTRLSDVKEEVWVSQEGIPIRQVTIEGDLKRSALLTELPAPKAP